MSSTLDPQASTHIKGLAHRYDEVRTASVRLTEPLEIEDFVVQSMPDVSPAKWHLAHTSWFFETFLLQDTLGHYKPFHPKFRDLFNSYYNAIGDQFPRPRRGVVTRPTTTEVFAYRQHVDDAMQRLLQGADESLLRRVEPLVEIGLQHEQQHQELMLTDIKHVFACNPLAPVYRAELGTADASVPPLRWQAHSGGLVDIGHGGRGFAFDNEGPRHRVFLEPFSIASRLVTNAEYLEFLADGAYERPELWLSDGWDAVQRNGWKAPLYWRLEDGVWVHMTLAGERPVRPKEPVCHVSFFEVDAYARWAGARLPCEEEWEVIADSIPPAGNFVDNHRFHPCPLGATDGGPHQMFGDVWEWTSSAYTSYPGYRPPEGALGEYNAKFMCNQMVLRGGSCATPQSHIRATYRNFYPPHARWQFMGARLARNEPS